jgi:hypothetical protein
VHGESFFGFRFRTQKTLALIMKLCGLCPLKPSGAFLQHRLPEGGESPSNFHAVGRTGLLLGGYPPLRAG